MALSFFDDDSSSSKDLEFAKDFLEQNPKLNGKSFTVHEVLKVKSGKGYLIQTDEFAGFLWKKSKVAKLLVQALEHYCQQNYGFLLVAVLDKTTKEGFKLAVDNTLTTIWYSLGNESFSTSKPSVSTLPEGIENPFLIPAPLHPSENGKGEGEEQGKRGLSPSRKPQQA